MKNDSFGDRMKSYESQETGRKLMPFIPIVCRVDGRNFSKFTKNADKPFDESISGAMLAATKALVAQTKPKIAYVQSDEISLVWEIGREEQMLFSGKIQKLTSIFSGIATAAFIRYLVKDPIWNSKLPNWIDKLPHFDARVFQVPNRTEACNMFVWREADARKNAITMVASSLYSHKNLQNKNGTEKREMIANKGVDFDDYPTHLTRGTFMRRETSFIEITDRQLDKIPTHIIPKINTVVSRTDIKEMLMPQFNHVINREQVIFDGADPIVRQA